MIAPDTPRPYAERVATVHSLTEVSRRGNLRDRVKSAIRRIAVPQPVRNLAAMPLTVAAAACFSAATLLVSLPGGLAVTGVVLIALEYMAADAE